MFEVSIEDQLDKLMESGLGKHPGAHEMLKAARSATGEGQFMYAYWILQGFIIGSDFSAPGQESISEFRIKLRPIIEEIYEMA